MQGAPSRVILILRMLLEQMMKSNRSGHRGKNKWHRGIGITVTLELVSTLLYFRFRLHAGLRSYPRELRA